jgi:hypothetical protein
VDPVPDPLFLRKSGSAWNRTRDFWICSQELDHYTTEAVTVLSPTFKNKQLRNVKTKYNMKLCKMSENDRDNENGMEQRIQKESKRM